MQKVIRMWSSLPDEVIEAGELNKFKGKEGIHLQPCNTTGQSTKKINLTVVTENRGRNMGPMEPFHLPLLAKSLHGSSTCLLGK